MTCIVIDCVWRVFQITSPAFSMHKGTEWNYLSENFYWRHLTPFEGHDGALLILVLFSVLFCLAESVTFIMVTTSIRHHRFLTSKAITNIRLFSGKSIYYIENYLIEKVYILNMGEMLLAGRLSNN